MSKVIKYELYEYPRNDGNRSMQKWNRVAEQSKDNGEFVEHMFNKIDTHVFLYIRKLDNGSLESLQIGQFDYQTADADLIKKAIAFYNKLV